MLSSYTLKGTVEILDPEKDPGLKIYTDADDVLFLAT